MTRRGELLKKLGYDQVEKPAKTNIGWASARMTAWTHVSESVYKSETPFTWRGHSWITMSVDKRGLWVSITG